MRKSSRLGSQQIPQACKESYDTNKLKESIAKIEFTLQLRNKEVQCLNLQIQSLKEENAIKTAYLQNQIISLKRESSDIRYDAVKSKRLQNQKCQKTIAAMRKNFDNILKQKNEQHRIICEKMKTQWREEIKGLREKHERLINIDIKQNYQDKRQYIEFSTNSNSDLIKSLQQEKMSLLKAKKEADQQIQTYSRQLLTLKSDFRKYTDEKNQQLTIKNGEIEGLKLQQNLLRERIQQFQAKQQNIHSDAYAKIEEFKQLNSKLTIQLEQFRLLVLTKDEKILNNCMLKNQSRQTLVTAVHECNHVNLIKQMERQIELKDQEIDQLKKTIEEWSESIGFDKSVSQRLEDISIKCHNTTNLNSNFVRSLKQKKKEGYKKMIFR